MGLFSQKVQNSQLKLCVTVLGATEVQISAPQPEQDQVAANESGENAQISPPRFEIVYQ